MHVWLPSKAQPIFPCKTIKDTIARTREKTNENHTRRERTKFPLECPFSPTHLVDNLRVSSSSSHGSRPNLLHDGFLGLRSSLSFLFSLPLFLSSFRCHSENSIDLGLPSNSPTFFPYFLSPFFFPGRLVPRTNASPRLSDALHISTLVSHHLYTRLHVASCLASFLPRLSQREKKNFHLAAAQLGRRAYSIRPVAFWAHLTSAGNLTQLLGLGCRDPGTGEGACDFRLLFQDG